MIPGAITLAMHKMRGLPRMLVEQFIALAPILNAEQRATALRQMQTLDDEERAPKDENNEKSDQHLS